MATVRGTPVAGEDFYKTAHWRQLRELQLREHPLCKFCLERGIVRPAKVVDHVEPHRGDWTKFVTGKLQSLCESCHNSAKRQMEPLDDDVERNERFERLERVYRTVLAGRDPETLFGKSLPAILAIVPDTNIEEVTAMFRWMKRKTDRWVEERERKLEASGGLFSRRRRTADGTR